MYKIITVYGDDFTIVSKQTAEEISWFLNDALNNRTEFVTFTNVGNRHIVLKLSEISRVEEL